MKLFMAFLVLCLLIGILPRVQPRKRIWMVIGLCGITCIGYYFFHQI
jgi:hypothetical protein